MLERVDKAKRQFIAALGLHPVLPILRGVPVAEVSKLAHLYYKAGIRALEIPLNHTDAFASIEALQNDMPSDFLIGAGTLSTQSQLATLAAMQVPFALSPHTDTHLIHGAINLGVLPIPGAASASEAMLATQAGASILKLFPAGTYGISHMQALRAVLPSATTFLAVGNLPSCDLPEWLAAGVAGLGLGSSLYQSGDTLADVEAKLQQVMLAIQP